MAWGGAMPLLLAGAVTLAFFDGTRGWLFAGLVFMIWPLRTLQIALRKLRAGMSVKLAGASGALLMIGKIPQLVGLAEFHQNRMLGRTSQLIEHKDPAEREG
jgi:hypothetical protein